MFFKVLKAIGRGIKGIGTGTRKFWQGKVTISGSLIIIILLVAAGFIGGFNVGRLSSPALVSAPPSVSAPAQKPTPAPAPAPTLAPVPTLAPTQAPTPAKPPTPKPQPTSKPIPAPELVTGQFKATMYRSSDKQVVGIVSGETTVDNTKGPLSRRTGVIMRWTGNFNVSSAGQYQFDYPGSADLYIDGVRVVAPINLKPGLHKLVLESGSPDQTIQLFWQEVY